MIYVILGSGLQGTACGYDIAKFGNPQKVIFTDICPETAQRAAKRVNRLLGLAIAEGCALDITDKKAAEAVMKGADIAVSALPYHFHQYVFEPAIATGTSYIHMGDDTKVTLELLKKDAEAISAGITVVPDCGLAPGLVNSMANYCMEHLDKTHSIKLYCGGLPQNPKPPLNYRLAFNIEGLIGEYIDEAVALRNGKLVELNTMEELEAVEFEAPFGMLEAFNTSSGTSTAPYTYEGKIDVYEYKTLRYPGHCEKMKLFRDFGFWDENPITVKGVSVKPFDVFCALAGPKLIDDSDKDVTLTRCVAEGIKDGKPCRLVIECIDKHDDATGFSSMERMTGFSAAIIAQKIAGGAVRKGCVAYEQALTGKAVLDALELRGITMKINWETSE